MRDQRAIGEKPAVTHTNLDNKKRYFQGFCTGATGLEPATSGVTGRSCWFRVERGYAGIAGESGLFRPGPCGDLRALPGVSGELLRDGRGME
jgi:hypothetical protein